MKKEGLVIGKYYVTHEKPMEIFRLDHFTIEGVAGWILHQCGEIDKIEDYRSAGLKRVANPQEVAKVKKHVIRAVNNF